MEASISSLEEHCATLGCSDHATCIQEL